MRSILFWFLFLANALSLISQETFPLNGAENSVSPTYTFINATLHTDASNVIENATFSIYKDRIQNLESAINPGSVVIDLKGKHVYPSFIDLYSAYGMPTAQSKERSNRPQYESSKHGAFGWNEALNPERNAGMLFKHDAKKAKVYRAQGFGAVLTHYSDGIHRGLGALVALGTNENRNLLSKEASAHLSFRKGKSSQSYPNSLMGVTALIRQSYLDAQWYGGRKGLEPTDLTLEAWLASQSLPQIFETTEMLDILRADRIGDEFHVQYIMKGNGDEYQRLDDIKATGCSLIIPVNYPKPFDVSDPFLTNTIEIDELKHWELAPYNPYFLADKEISFSFTSHGLKDQSDFLKNVRRAVRYGLSEEKALEALTVIPAMQLEMSDELGVIAPGFRANFIITDKNIFHEKSVVLENWVQGEKFNVNNSPELALEGDYNLSYDNKLYRVRLKKEGKAVILKEAEIDAHDSLGVKLTFKQTKPFVNFNYSFKSEEGIYRLSGSDIKNGKILEGRGNYPDGKEFEWIAVKQIATASIPKKIELPQDSSELASPYELLIYPFKAYGRADTLQAETILIKDATIWTCDSIGKLDRGQILFTDGKIAAVGKEIKLEEIFGKKWKEEPIKILDGFGMHVTPGIIDEHSHIAISRGVNEGSQASTAEVRIGDSVNSEDVNIYRQLAGGVTTSQLLHGSANPIGGQSALIKLRWGENPENLKFKDAPGFIKFALGENVNQSNWGDNYNVRFPQSRMGVEQVYYDHFHRAIEYKNEWIAYELECSLLTKKQLKRGEVIDSPRIDLELEALAEILESERFVTCHSYMQHEINMLMHVADSMGFTLNTFTHILEGYKLADKMKAHGAGASSFSDWWAYKYEVKDAIPFNGALLWEQGITVAYNSDDAEMARRLNHEAAKAVKYGGVPEEEALKFVTLNPAKLLHIDDKVGSLAFGKDADFVIWNNHPLSVYAKPLSTYIDGKCYFSLEKDIERRSYIAEERNRIIQLMATEGVTEGSQMPGKKRSQHYHCNTITNELH
jgi:imidazolonepropionase-like amidohydrolase